MELDPVSSAWHRLGGKALTNWAMSSILELRFCKRYKMKLKLKKANYKPLQLLKVY